MTDAGFSILLHTDIKKEEDSKGKKKKTHAVHQSRTSKICPKGRGGGKTSMSANPTEMKKKDPSKRQRGLHLTIKERRDTEVNSHQRS